MCWSTDLSWISVHRIVGGCLLLASSLSVFAGGGNIQVTAGRVPQPVVESAIGGNCVEDPAFMRRNHMELLKHQRDDTLRGGVRTGKYSLRTCIECHASQSTASVISEKTNFCQSCHSYTAVRIDCFECHASKPRSASSHSLKSQGKPVDQLSTFQPRQVAVQQQAEP
jgi:hypothetical protein